MSSLVQDQIERQARRIDAMAANLPIAREERRFLDMRESELTFSLRALNEEIALRPERLEALRREREALLARLEQIYRPSSLEQARYHLSLWDRLHGSEATASALRQEPSRFGKLQGFSRSPRREQALRAARSAAFHLEAADRHLSALDRVPPQFAQLHLDRIRAELGQVRKQLQATPTFRSLQKDLVRAVEATGGIHRLRAFLSPTAFKTLQQALHAVRSLQAEHGR